MRSPAARSPVLIQRYREELQARRQARRTAKTDEQWLSHPAADAARKLVTAPDAGTAIMQAPRTLRPSLDRDGNDLMLAMLDPQRRTLTVRVSRHY
ncbi:MAG: hypothetical protein ACKO0M_18220 [Cyanobium sp.]